MKTRLLLLPLLLLCATVFAQNGQVTAPDRYHWYQSPQSVNPLSVNSLNGPPGITVNNTTDGTQYFKLSPRGDNSCYPLFGDFLLFSGPTYTLFTTSTSNALNANQFIWAQGLVSGTLTYSIQTLNPFALAAGTGYVSSGTYTAATVPVDTSTLPASQVLTGGTSFVFGNPFFFKSLDVLVLSSSAVSAAPIIQAQGQSLTWTGTSFTVSNAALTGTATLTGTAAGNYQSFAFTSPGTALYSAGELFTTSTSNTLASGQYLAGQIQVGGTNIYTIGTITTGTINLNLVVSGSATLSATNGYLNVSTFWRGFKAW